MHDANRSRPPFGQPAVFIQVQAARRSSACRPLRPIVDNTRKTSGLSTSILNFRTTTLSSITAYFNSLSQALSSRALEKQSAKPSNPSRDDQLIRNPRPGQQENLATTALPQIPSPVAHQPRPNTFNPLQRNPRYRTSFLTTFLARQQNKELRNVTPPAIPSRVLNPINHIPRPTPAHIVRSEVVDFEGTLDELVGFEERTLLTLPEQRRSRQNSPNTPTFQDTFVADGENTHRTSIGLPHNRQRSLRSLEYNVVMAQNGETTSRTQSPIGEKRDNAPSKQQAQEENLTSKFSLDFGFNPQDQPSQPPRRVSSQRSNSHGHALGSISSPSYNRGTPTALPQNGPSPPQSQPQPDTQAKQPMSSQPTHPQSYDLEQGPDSMNHATLPNEPAEQMEDPPWGPSHPCYPHLNPHVPLHSPLYNSTRVIRIRRDWMVVGDLAPCYSNIYPEILDPFLPELEFRYIIQHINKTLIKAFDPFRLANCVDGILGFLTGWFWEDLRTGGVKGELKKLEKWLEDWNRTVGAQDGVKLIPLRRTGYLSLDIQIPDPQVRIVDSDDEHGQDRDRNNNATPRPEVR